MHLLFIPRLLACTTPAKMGQSLSSVFEDTIYTNFALTGRKLASHGDHRSNLRKCTAMCKYYASMCFARWDPATRQVVVLPPNPMRYLQDAINANDPGVHWPTLFFVMALDRDVTYGLSFRISVDANLDVLLRRLCTEMVEDSAKQDSAKHSAKQDADDDALDHAHRLRSMSLDVAARIVATAMFKSFVQHSTLMAHHFPSAAAIYPSDEDKKKATEERINRVADIMRHARTKKDVSRFQETIEEAIAAYDEAMAL